MFKRITAAVTGAVMLIGSAASMPIVSAAEGETSRHHLTAEYREAGRGIVKDQTDGSNNSPQIKIVDSEPAAIIVKDENLSKMGCASVTFAQCGGSLEIKLSAVETPDLDAEGTLLVDEMISDVAYDWKTKVSPEYKFQNQVPEGCEYLKLEFAVANTRDNATYIDYVDLSPLTLVQWRSVSSGMVLDVTDEGTDNGNTVIAADTEENKASQQWRMRLGESAEEGWYYIVNENSGKAIGMMGGTIAAGAKPVQWTADNSTNQFWRFVEVEKDGNTYYKILNKNSKLVLTAGDDLTQEVWTGDDNQLWEPVEMLGDFNYGSKYDDNYSITGVTAEAENNIITYSVMYTCGEGMVLKVTLSDADGDIETKTEGAGSFTITKDGEYTLTASLYANDGADAEKVCEDASKLLTVENGGYTVIGAKWTSTTESDRWANRGTIETREVTSEDIETIKTEAENYIAVDQNTRYQTMDDHPWGGCFNEAGWYTMGSLSEEQKKEVVRRLFGTDEDSLNFTAGRTPIGSSDYGVIQYTYDETVDDYELKDFSIERDNLYLIPYIKAAMDYVPDLQLFSSPWSPPSWMKTNNQLTGYASPNNTIEDTPENFASYAKYFVKYLEAYSALGIDIHAVTPQNEPTMATAYPSCLWTGEQLNVFLRDYLADAVKAYNEENGKDVGLWLGTFTDSNKSLAMPTLKDEKTSKLIDAVCFQWWGAPLATQIHMTDKSMKLVQSETKCGNGLNNWQYAEEQFDCFKEFLDAGISQYFLWNMILDSRGGNNGGGWKQNAPITVDGTNIQYRPSYYITKHFSSNIKAGARRIKVEGSNLGEGSVKGYVQDLRAIGFQNTDGEIVLNVKNSTAAAKAVTVIVNNEAFDVTVPAHSINTFKLDGTYENTPDATEEKVVAETTDIKLTNLETNFLLSCEGYNNGAVVNTTTNQGESYQTWSLSEAEKDGDTQYYYLQNFRSDLVLCVWGGSKEENATISQYDNTGAPDQMWAPEFVEYRGRTAYYKIINRNSGLALTALGENAEDAAKSYLVTQKAYTGAANQLWAVTVVGGDWEYPDAPSVPDEPSTETEITVNNGKYTLSTALNNIEPDSVVIAAAYSESGECVSVKIIPAENSEVISEFDADERISEFKIMVWNSMNGMTSVTPCETKLKP
ncbi:MAG: RICIN domain-containing protein [Candidatus Ornithomonoglobus sp.]